MSAASLSSTLSLIARASARSPVQLQRSQKWLSGKLTFAPAMHSGSRDINSVDLNLLMTSECRPAGGHPARTRTCCSAAKDVESREVLVQHLLVKEDDLNTLLELQKRLIQEDVDLSDLATEHSICPSGKEGGMIGWISKGQTVPEFEEAAFSAPLNKVRRVKTKHGWHLVQVLAEREASRLEQIAAEEFAGRMEEVARGEEEETVQLIDVREDAEITTASIPGFKSFPLSRFGEWAGSIAEEMDPNKDTYVMCHHGVRSQQAANWLKSQKKSYHIPELIPLEGFKRLFNIIGGIDAYSLKVDPTIPRY